MLVPAAYHGHADIVRMLEDYGADRDLFHERGRTPSAGAVIKKESGVVRVLLEIAADPRAGADAAVDTVQMFSNQQFLAGFSEE
ncbi:MULTISPECIES: hypothetical protein [Nonomuraea]|uniref:Ankyrin repeat domain-containing protein n=1 Tax=Nonomuraea mangrovi TaxID=2316207 RepID=A0ABW4SW92_9ACTN